MNDFKFINCEYWNTNIEPLFGTVSSKVHHQYTYSITATKYRGPCSNHGTHVLPLGERNSSTLNVDLIETGLQIIILVWCPWPMPNKLMTNTITFEFLFIWHLLLILNICFSSYVSWSGDSNTIYLMERVKWIHFCGWWRGLRLQIRVVTDIHG